MVIRPICQRYSHPDTRRRYPKRVTVHVKWFPTLVKRMQSKQATTEVDWHAGLTAHEVFRAEGFSDADGESVLVLINDSQAEGTDLLKDGDRLEFMVSIQGG